MTSPPPPPSCLPHQRHVCVAGGYHVAVVRLQRSGDTSDFKCTRPHQVIFQFNLRLAVFMLLLLLQETRDYDKTSSLYIQFEPWTWKLNFRNWPTDWNSLSQHAKGSFLLAAHEKQLQNMEELLIQPFSIIKLRYDHLLAWRTLTTPSFHFSCWKQNLLGVHTYNTCTRAGMDPPPRRHRKTRKLSCCVALRLRSCCRV